MRKEILPLKLASSLLLLALLLIPFHVHAGGVSTSSAQFLDIPSGVRGAGMGGMFTAVADDVTTTYWNTAGLALVNNIELNLSEVSYFEGVNYNFAGLAFPLKKGSVIGVSGSFDFTPSFNSTNNPLATPGSANDYMFSLSYAQAFGSNLALGAGAKKISSTLVNSSVSGAAIDAGLLLFTDDRVLTLGLSVQNIGQLSNSVQYLANESLAMTSRIGLVYRIDPKKSTRYLLGVDVEDPLDTERVVHTGGEAWFGGDDFSVAFRAGYSFNPLNQDLGGAVGASLGAGVETSGFEVNYALVPFGILGDTHRVSITYRFDSDAGPAPKSVSAAPVKLNAIDIKPQISDYQTGTLSNATFDLKPQARTDIKNWTLDITDAKGNVLRHYDGKGVPPKQIAWDGRDNNGNVVGGGMFANYNFRTVDSRGQQVMTSDPIYKSAQVSSREVKLLASASSQPQIFTVPVIPEKVEPLGETGAINVPSILFQENNADMSPAFLNYLDQVAKLIRQYPNSHVYIEGYSFQEGSDREGLILSQKRADAVLMYLVEKGKVSPDNLYSRGHGDSAVLNANNTEDAQIKNRRVDIVILTK
jgi:outer membrane protein OmpA-like peptidoglycan-associated protein